MGRDIQDFENELNGKDPNRTASRKAFQSKVGIDLLGVNRHLRIINDADYTLEQKVVPSFDLTKVVTRDQIEINQESITLIDGNTNYRITSPVDYDYTYIQLSVSLSVARAMDITIYAEGGSVGVNAIPGMTASSNQILNRQQLPFFVPSQFILQISINSSLAVDGAANVAYMRVKRPRNAGYFPF